MRLTWQSDGLGFVKNNAIRPWWRSPKAVDIGNPIGLDRFAAWNEVICEILAAHAALWHSAVTATICEKWILINAIQRGNSSIRTGGGSIRQEAKVQKGFNHARTGDRFEYLQLVQRVVCLGYEVA